MELSGSSGKARTLQDVWRLAVNRLSGAGIEEAAADAELLLLHLLGKSKAELLRDWREPWLAEAEIAERWEKMLRRRESGEPVQYVTGEQHFFGRRFIVEPGAVLIPRPETELLAEAVLSAADRLWAGCGSESGDNVWQGSVMAGEDRERHAGGGTAPGDSVWQGSVMAGEDREREAGGGTVPGDSVWQDGRAGVGPIVLDVGTGSGALAVTLAAERPLWRVIASDLSSDALDVARRNAELHGVSERIEFVQGNLLEPFLATAGGVPVDVLVSNPPYIPSGDLPGLQREVREFEPHLALDGGGDGLDPYRRMAQQLVLLPKIPRLVAWEVGAGQAEDVAALLRAAADWTDIRFVVDYAGINRHVIATR